MSKVKIAICSSYGGGFEVPNVLKEKVFNSNRNIRVVVGELLDKLEFNFDYKNDTLYGNLLEGSLKTDTLDYVRCVEYPDYVYFKSNRGESIQILKIVEVDTSKPWRVK